MSATASLIKRTIGNYRVTRLLGEGGMGVVYLAQHPVIGRKVAIKLLHVALARDQDIVSRFFNEARAIHMIAHANIVEILDFGQTTDGQPYFIMEFLEGEALSEAVARGPMTPEEVEAIGVQMCRALWAAHAKGIVHRDLKPHNVQLVPRPEGTPLVKILDFGVAKILASPDGAQSVKTRTGSLMGTPLYMSPEQCKGAGTLDHRTDIYSLGVMLFEMLSGRPPFVAQGVGELFAKHMLEEPPSLLDFAPNTPPHMAAAIMNSLQKEPRDRFQSMDEFRKALVGEVKLAPRRRAPRPYGRQRSPARRPFRRRRRPRCRPRRPNRRRHRAAERPQLEGDGRGRCRRRHRGRRAAGRAEEPRQGGAPPRRPRSPRRRRRRSLLLLRPRPWPRPSRCASRPSLPAPTCLRKDGKKDGKDLGESPVELQVPKGAEPSAYLFRLAGYREVALSAKPNADRTLHVSLEKLPAPAASDTKHRAAAHHGGAQARQEPRRRRRPGTPSF